MRADHFSPDVQELITLLQRNQVRFLMVGGEAVIFHGYPRLTGDVDLWWEQTADNARRLFRALGEFWNGPIPGLAEEEELLQPTVVVQFGRPPHRIDFLSAIDGVAFRDAWPRRVEEALLFPDGGQVPLYVIGLVDLLANKRASARHKDLDDVQQLEAISRRP